MRFELTDTQRDIQKAAKEFAEKEFDLDLALELEKEGRFPKSIFEKACQLGFIGIDYPEQYGGQSFGLFENVLVIEEFTRKDSGIGISISLADIASGVLLRHGRGDNAHHFGRSQEGRGWPDGSCDVQVAFRLPQGCGGKGSALQVVADARLLSA